MEDILEMVRRASHRQEVYQVTTFVAYRDGRTPVTIEVFDRGPASADLRYSVTARDDEGHTSTGNADGDMGVALQLVHWHVFDP